MFFVTLTTLCVQATADIPAMEAKIKQLEKQVSNCDIRLKNHDTRLQQLESKPSLCSKYMSKCFDQMEKIRDPIIVKMFECWQNIAIDTRQHPPFYVLCEYEIFGSQFNLLINFFHK